MAEIHIHIHIHFDDNGNITALTELANKVDKVTTSLQAAVDTSKPPV